jgi:hypothetical protein
MKNLLERRTENRIYLRNPVFFELTAFDSGSLINTIDHGRGVDVSIGGMAMTTGYPLKAGQIVRLVTAVAGAGSSLPLLTEVMWSTFADGEFKAGLRYLL